MQSNKTNPAVSALIEIDRQLYTKLTIQMFINPSSSFVQKPVAQHFLSFNHLSANKHCPFHFIFDWLFTVVMINKFKAIATTQLEKQFLKKNIDNLL